MEKINGHLRKAMGKRIRDARIKRFNGRVNQKQMAKILNVPYRTYQNWELGIREPRKKEIRIILANWLEVDPGYLEYGPKTKMSPAIKELLELTYPKKR